MALALNDIGLGSALEQIISDDRWLDDASGVLPHCLAILRTCHALIERLAELAMRPMRSATGASQRNAAAAGGAGHATARLIEATRRVPSRVDDVVRSMHPPFDVRLLEARLAALVLAVGQVALLTQQAVAPATSGGGADGDVVAEEGRLIDGCLSDMDGHLAVLRTIARRQQEQDEQIDDHIISSSEV